MTDIASVSLRGPKLIVGWSLGCGNAKDPLKNIFMAHKTS